MDGFFLGFAAGAAFASVFYLLLMILAAWGQRNKEAPIHDYWRHSMAFQEQQIETLKRMAEAMEERG